MVPKTPCLGYFTKSPQNTGSGIALSCAVSYVRHSWSGCVDTQPLVALRAVSDTAVVIQLSCVDTAWQLYQNTSKPVSDTAVSTQLRLCLTQLKL